MAEHKFINFLPSALSNFHLNASLVFNKLGIDSEISIIISPTAIWSGLEQKLVGKEARDIFASFAPTKVIRKVTGGSANLNPLGRGNRDFFKMDLIHGNDGISF